MLTCYTGQSWPAEFRLGLGKITAKRQRNENWAESYLLVGPWKVMGKFPPPFVSLKRDHGHCEGWGVLEPMGPRITSLEDTGITVLPLGSQNGGFLGCYQMVLASEQGQCLC